MDFSSIPWLETALNYSVGGISVFAILVVATKIITWLKNNTLDGALKTFTETITGKDINIDLTVLAEKRLAEIKGALGEQILKQAEIIRAQSAVLTDIADVISKSKLVSEAQFKALQAHTELSSTSQQSRENVELN